MSKKWFLYLILPLLIIAFSVQLILKSRFVSKKLTEIVVEQLSAAVTLPVSIEGVSLHLFPPRVHIKAPSIGREKEPFSFSAKGIWLSIDPASLLTEIFVVRKIEINEPVFDLVLVDLEQPLLSKIDSSPLGSAAPKILIREITIKKGQLHFQGDGPIARFVLSNFESTLKPNIEMNRLEVSLASREGAFSGQGIQKPINLLETQFILSRELLEIKKAKMIASTASVSAYGMLQLQNERSLDLNIDLDVPLSSVSRVLAGKTWAEPLVEAKVDGVLNFFGTLSGSLKDPKIEGKLTLPDLKIQDQTVGSVRADLRYHGDNVALSPFSGILFSGTFSGEAEARLGGEEKTEGALSFSSAAGSESQVAIPAFNIDLEYDALPIAKLIPSFPKGLSLQAEDFSGLLLTGALNLSKFESGAQPEAGAFRSQGSLQLSRHAPRARPETSTAPQPAVLALLDDAELNWAWAEKTLQLRGGRIALRRTAVGFEGRWSESEGLFLETILVSPEIAPLTQAIHLPLTGRLNLQGAVSRKNALFGFRGGLFLDKGTLRGQPFKDLTADLSLSGSKLEVKKAVLSIAAKAEDPVFRSPAGLYLASGILDWGDAEHVLFDFDLKVEDGNPQEIFDFLDLTIPLYATGTGLIQIKGQPKSFFVKGPLSISKGLLYGEYFDSGSLDLTVNEKEVLLDKVVLKKGKSLLTGQGGIGYDQRYWLSLKGDHLRIKETHLLGWMPEEIQGEVGLVVSGKGSFSTPQFRFVAAVTNLNYGELSDVRGAIRADWINHSVQFEAEFPDHHIALTGEIHLTTDYPFDFEGHFEQLQIDPLFRQHLKGPSKAVRVRASGNLSGQGKLFSPERISLSGTLSEVVAGFDAYELHNKGSLAVKATEGKFVFNDAVFEGENTALTLNGSLTLKEEWNLFIDGLADLSLISFFSKKIASGRGLAKLDLVITDQWQNPSVRGALSIENGTLRLEDMRQAIRVNELNALFDQERVILENLRGHVGGGRFFATGKAELEGLQVKDFSLLVELNGIRFDLAQDLPGTFEGELFFQKKGEQQSLKGDLEVQDVVYDKKTDLKTIIVDFINRKAPELEGETPIIGQSQINIHIYGKENLQINNNLAKLPLTTDLLVKGTFDQPEVLGRVELLDGDIFFQRNTFRVVSGSVDFLNPDEIDPIFNLVARTDVRNEVTDRRYRIDLGLTGTLSQITLNWSSFPALPEVDILALLAIGKTTADLAETQGDAGAEATNFVVNAFLVEPVDQITQIVGAPVEQLTGIDQIRVDPYVSSNNANTTASTRVTAKKRLLKDRLVVIYTTTLDASEEDVFRMVYEINKHLSLVGKRDDLGRLGGDLRFRFEFR